MQMSVEYNLSHQQMDRLRLMLDVWRAYTTPDGVRPFQAYTLEQMFQTVMSFGAGMMIDEQLRSWECCEYMTRLKTTGKAETPAKITAGELIGL
ncbi:hypothetical protein D7X87_17000 [bacterium D16-54]|nr:hypothetical protein D7X87_17000 [bacterium D16-54]RKJ13180.1 hypothetical protein D7X65_17135 [bacterium D16-56]